MSKRILSIALALAVMLVSLPLLPINIGSISADAATAPGDLSLDAVTWPQYATDRVINDFNDASTSYVDADGNTVSTGIGTNLGAAGALTTDYVAANDNSSNQSLVIEGGKLKATITSESGAFRFKVYTSGPREKSPSVNTAALRLKVDFTGITSVAAGTKVEFLMNYYVSSGTSSGWVGYGADGKTFYYISDTTGEMKTLTTTGRNYHGQLYGYAGESGTLIIPISYWDETFNFGKNTTYDQIYKYWNGADYNRNYFDIYSEWFTAAQGDVLALDNAEWIMSYPVGYDFKEEVEDFSDFTINVNGNWPWGNITGWSQYPGSAHSSSIYAIGDDGRLAITPLADATDGTIMYTTLEGITPWASAYKAFAYDLDVSTLTDPYLRMRFHVRDKDEGYSGNTGANSSSFGVYTGSVYFLWENGKVDVATYAEGATYTTQIQIPTGFKGQVVVPVESISRYSGSADLDVLEGVAASETDKFSFELQIINWKAADTGESYYVDNLKYYYNAPALAEGAGTDFSALDNSMYQTEALVSGDIRTVEAWIKTDATVDQMFIAEKFDGTVSNPTHIEDVQFTDSSAADYGKNLVCKSPGFRMGMTATGNPYFFMADMDCNFISYTCTDAVINDGDWQHVAFVIDESMNEIRCYVNGVNVGAQSFVSETDSTVIYKVPANDLLFPLTVGNRMANNSRVNTPFNGTIANVRLWSDVRTGTELYNNSADSVGASAQGLIAEWLLSGDALTTETTGNYDLETYWWDAVAGTDEYNAANRDAAEGEYTIAFLPDTQCVNYLWPDDFIDSYNWIIENSERLNIQAVMGLGDIVEHGSSYKVDGVTTSSEPEWIRADAAFATLTEANIPWTVVPGNHDYDGNSPGGRKYTFFKKYFTPDKLVSNEKFTLGGLYEENDLSNAFYYLTPNENVKYILLCLELEPRSERVEWARQVIENHPDYRIIVTTHEYMNSAGRVYTHDTKDMYTGGSSGEDLWEKILSPYKNVDMILGGHSSFSSMISYMTEGTNGNDILQVLCDTQQIDYNYAPANAILIARFSADGSQVTFNLYSPSQDIYFDSDVQGRTYTLGAVTEEKEDASDNYGSISSSNLFTEGTIVNDFEYLKGSEIHTGTIWSGSTNVKPYWRKGTVVADFPVVEGATTNDVSFQIQNQPNAVKGEGYTAMAIHVDASGASTNNGIRITLGTGNGSGYVLGGYGSTGGHVYLLTDAGVLTQHNAGHNAVSIPAGFQGYLIIPFINTFGSSSTIENPEDICADTAGNSAYFKVRALGGGCGDTLIFDNYQYLKGGMVSIPVLNANGEEIDRVVVAPDADQAAIESAVAANVTAPVKYGYECIGWENVADVEIAAAAGLTPIYNKIDTEEYTYSVTTEDSAAKIYYPEGQSSANYNDRVVATAPETNAAGESFSYWTANGAIFSYHNTISFLAFGDVKMVPVYGEEVTDTTVVYNDPIVTTSVSATDGKFNMHVMGVVSAEDAATVTEIGILLAASEMTAEEMVAGYEAADNTVYKMQAGNATVDRQFVYTVKNIPDGATRCAVTYAIITVDGVETMVVCKTPCVVNAAE